MIPWTRLIFLCLCECQDIWEQIFFEPVKGDHNMVSNWMLGAFGFIDRVVVEEGLHIIG